MKDKYSTHSYSNKEKKSFEAKNALVDNLLSSKISPMDNPSVFANRQAFTSTLSRIKLFEMIRDVKGSIVECGCHQGNGLFTFYHMSSIIEPYAFTRKIYSFDSFKGFKSIDKNDKKDRNESEFSDTDYEILKNLIIANDDNRPISHIPKVELIMGDACETIPKFVLEKKELLISMLYLDFDLYKPTLTALKHLLPLVVKGGVVVFDEINHEKWVGETLAFKEILDPRKVKLKKFSFDPGPAYFIVE